MTQRLRLTRRELLAVAGALGLLTAAGCAIEHPTDPPDGSATPEPPSGRRSTDADDPAAAAFLAGQSGAALALLRAAYAEDDTANAVISPLSIAQALAMSAQGAQGATLDEMAAFYGAGDAAELASGANAQLTALAALEHAEVSVANTAFVDAKLPLIADYQETVSEFFGATAQQTPLSTDQDPAAEQINAWVAAHTDDKITELISAELLNEDSRLVLVNAVYLLARWADQFDPQRTSPGPFTTPGGEVIADKMRDRRDLPYAARDGVQVIELGYEDDALAAYLVLPDPGTLPGFLAGLQPESLWGLIDAMAEREVALAVPTFEVRQQLELTDTLKAEGMATAFTDQADFSRLSSEPTKIAFVVHEAWLKVAEKGTEAAAATGSGAEAGSAPADPPLELDVDRPFLFLVTEQTTRSILFACVVNDPTSVPG